MAKKFKNVAQMVEKLNLLKDSLFQVKVGTQLYRGEVLASDVLNSGGCAWFASLVGKTANINFLGCTVLDRCDSETFQKAASLAENNPEVDVWWWLTNGVEFRHVVATFLIDGCVYFFDGVDGLIEKSKYLSQNRWLGKDVGMLTIEQAEALTKTTKGWNPTFKQSYKKHIADKVYEILGRCYRPRAKKAVV